MADVSRVQRLASARKKLKKFQKTKKPETSNSKPDNSKNDVEIDDLQVDDDHDQLVNPNPQVVSDIPSLDINTEQNVTQEKEIFARVPPSLFQDSSTSENNPDKASFLDIPAENCDSSNNIQPTVSSSESIRQISLQLNGLMNDGQHFLNGQSDSQNDGVQQLEIRNQELASNVEQQQQLVLQLQSENQQLKTHNQTLQLEISKEREQLDEKLSKEQGSLKEQLQVHIQTIGILVAEKTELQSALSQTQRTAKQKSGQVDELDGRLKATRQRITELDKQLADLQSNKDQYENDCKQHSKEVEKLKISIYKLTKSNEEFENQVSELVEKLQVKSADCNKAEKELIEANKKVSLAELRVEQLSSSNNTNILEQLEQLNLSNIQLEAKISQDKESFQKLSQERDHLTEQYQQYIQQLNQQITSLTDQLSSTSDECLQLKTQNKDLLHKLDCLSQETKIEDSKVMAGDSQQLDLLKQDVQKLEETVSLLRQQLEQQVAEKNELADTMYHKEMKVEELENLLSRIQEESVDKEKLLDTIESDKIAASRAVAQNKQLKTQLEELQQAFVQMSNDKLQATESMLSEQHKAKELVEQLQAVQSEMQLKNNELIRMTQQNYELNQINDHAQHYEAQGQLSAALQHDLALAQDQISALTTENAELKSLFHQQRQSTAVNNEKTSSDPDQDSKKDDMVASLSASVQQLELERDQLLRQLDTQKTSHRNLQNKLTQLQDNPSNLVKLNGDIGSNEETAMLKDTLAKLEERFTKTMAQIAELSEQKQQLEHLVLQLQGETETIGDYIALYQVQRGLMKKWAAEKDDHITQLSRDREELKFKLSQLQLLVTNLVNKKSNDTEQISESHSLSSRSVSPVKPLQINHLTTPHQNNGADNDRVSPSAKEWDNVSTVSSEYIPTTVSQYYPINDQAKKIMDLISDIGNTTLGDKPVLESFHPCSVCSGRLITV